MDVLKLNPYVFSDLASFGIYLLGSTNRFSFLQAVIHPVWTIFFPDDRAHRNLTVLFTLSVIRCVLSSQLSHIDPPSDFMIYNCRGKIL